MELRSALLGFCVIVFTGVALTMLVLCWMHHRNPTKESGNFHVSVWMELAWTLTPLLMALALAWPTVQMVWAR